MRAGAHRSKSRTRLLALAAFLASLGARAPADAQIFMSAPPSLQRLTPAEAKAPEPRSALAASAVPPAAREEPSNAKETEASPPVTAQAAPRRSDAENPGGDVLRHLPNNVQGFRLSGETGSSEWPFYVTTAQARSTLRFQIGYLAAVSVMPEASHLTLTINDVVVGRTNIVGTRGVRTAVFNMPAGLVKPGFNSVRLSAEHRHRVDCSLEATYELWTQIDPTLTGLVLPKDDPGVANIAELAGFPPDEEGAMPIRVVLPRQTGLASVERALRVVQDISLAGRFAQPSVDVGPMADGEYGLNLVIGAADEVVVALGQVNIGAITGPRVALLPASRGQRSTIVLTGRDDNEVNEAIKTLASAAELKGSREGLRAAAAFPGVRVEGGQTVRFSDLGLSSEEFSGRLYRAAFNIMMPPDFYPADYAKAHLLFDGGYAPGLSKGAQIVISVNERNVVSQKLTKSGGDVFREDSIPLPLGSLRPGLNRIEFEAQLPSASDDACDPLAAISGGKRFLFLDSSKIEIPKIGRIARMPDLSVTATGGYPYAGATRPTLYLPAPSREAVGAAATLAAHLAIAAGASIDFHLTTQDPGAAGPVFIVGTADALTDDILRGVSLDPAKLAAIWPATARQARTGAPASGEKLSKYEAMARHRLVLQKNFPAACHMPAPEGGYRNAERMAGRDADRTPVGSTTPPNRDLYGQWNVDIRGEGGVLGELAASYNSVTGAVVRRLSGARNWIDTALDGKFSKPAFTTRASLIVAQDLRGSSGDGVRTLVVAPNAEALARGVDCLVDPRVWRQIDGQAAVLNAADGEIADVPSENPRLIPTQALSIENARLIVAGWFSLNSKMYVELALCLALLLAWTTRGLLKSVGRNL